MVSQVSKQNMCRSSSPTSEVRSLEPITRPYCEEDVDRELWDLLDLANDDELEAVHDILYGVGPSSHYRITTMTITTMSSCITHSSAYVDMQV